jgi:hypothetical protein
MPTTHHQEFFWRRCRGLKKKLPRQLHAPTSTTRQKHFSSAVAGEKEDFCKGSLLLSIFYFVIALLTFFTLFLFASFYQKYKKISFFYS